VPKSVVGVAKTTSKLQNANGCSYRSQKKAYFKPSKYEPPHVTITLSLPKQMRDSGGGNFHTMEPCLSK
jgi:hypothetical protein